MGPVRDPGTRPPRGARQQAIAARAARASAAETDRPSGWRGPSSRPPVDDMSKSQANTERWENRDRGRRSRTRASSRQAEPVHDRPRPPAGGEDDDGVCDQRSKDAPSLQLCEQHCRHGALRARRAKPSICPGLHHTGSSRRVRRGRPPTRIFREERVAMPRYAAFLRGVSR